jgi:hypothetical protein
MLTIDASVSNRGFRVVPESRLTCNRQCQVIGDRSDRVLINACMSSARQAVQRADNFIGFGKRPDLTPFHQHVLPRGITLKTCRNRKNPVSGISCISKPPLSPNVPLGLGSIMPRSLSSRSITPILSIVPENTGYVPMKVALTAALRVCVCWRPLGRMCVTGGGVPREAKYPRSPQMWALHWGLMRETVG